MKDVNFETITSTQSWYKNWPLNGIQSYPCKTKTSQETERSSRKFLEPSEKPKVIYTEISLDFGKSFQEVSWNHCTSTHHRFETHGIAQRRVRRIKEGTSAVLLQTGMKRKMVKIRNRMSFFPISWTCKKQTSVSHSSTESEVISLDAGLHMDCIPVLDLWELVI